MGNHHSQADVDDVSMDDGDCDHSADSSPHSGQWDTGVDQSYNGASQSNALPDSGVEQQQDTGSINSAAVKNSKASMISHLSAQLKNIVSCFRGPHTVNSMNTSKCCITLSCNEVNLMVLWRHASVSNFSVVGKKGKSELVLIVSFLPPSNIELDFPLISPAILARKKAALRERTKKQNLTLATWVSKNMRMDTANQRATWNTVMNEVERVGLVTMHNIMPLLCKYKTVRVVPLRQNRFGLMKLVTNVLSH